jgi:hypothetical protein
MTLNPLLSEIGALEKNVMTVLAVAGGFLIGFVATGLVATVFSKLVLKRPSPERLGRFLRVLGGAAGAIAVYLLLSGEGGLGLGGKGGGGSSSLADGQQTPAKSTANKDETPKTSPTLKSKDDNGGKPLSVYVFGADSPDNRFFRFGDDPMPLTKTEVVERIEKLVQSGAIYKKEIRVEAGAENMSVPQYAVIHTLLSDTFGPRGFKISTSTGSAGPKKE